MTAPSSDPTAPRERLRSARRELERVAALERQYLESNPYRLLHAYDPRTGSYTVRAEVLREMPSEVRDAVANVLRDSRAALDALVATLASSATGKPPRFPIHDSLPEFAQRSRRPLAGLPDEAQATIEELQPYHTFGGFHLDRLWLLRELTDHEPRLAAGGLRADSALGVNTARHVEITGDLNVRAGAFESDAVIVSVPARVSGRDPKLDLFLKPIFELAFAATGPARGGALVGTLGAICDHVEHAVMKRLELSLRIGRQGLSSASTSSRDTSPK